jgi:hypothetical protein
MSKVVETSAEDDEKHQVNEVATGLMENCCFLVVVVSTTAVILK